MAEIGTEIVDTLPAEESAPYTACSTDTNSDMGCCTSKNKGASDKYVWEQRVLEDTVMKGGKVSHAAIVSFSDAELRAATPRSFTPNKKALKDIVDALKGDTDGVSGGISMGGGTKVVTPGKLDEGKAIYGTDGKGGGMTAFKSRHCVLIVHYDKDPAPATRLATEVAEYMEENDH